ncbi:Crp/Fnr family transcriptional regulator [Levyella massiliensis]|uniref:Crp/Fnr family transcriptional regulator n=1 Tax=Levyella massiliensis TaxID=938289 RepID=UPI003999F0A0
MNDDLLKKSILFKGMTDPERDECLLTLNAHRKSYKKGDAILHAGNLTDQMGMVLSGSVTIESNDMWGNRTILSQVGTGQFFAETYALLPEEVMLVDVVANENCQVLFLHVGNMISKMQRAAWSQKLYRNLLLISSHKNLTLSGRSFHTAPKSARGRILAYLNTVSLKKHSTEFDIPFDRQQLADYLNLERTNMSKELTRMRREGIIECRKNHFKLLQ